MTPFGNALSHLRRSRKLLQRELAVLVGIKPCYISAMENGKKGPPSPLIFNNIVNSLNLSLEEENKLEKTLEQSEKVIRLPDTTSLDEYHFIWELRQRLGSLSREELAIMINALRLGSAQKLKEDTGMI